MRQTKGKAPLELLTTEEAAAVLRVAERTLRTWRQTGEGPRFVKVGQRVTYNRADVEAWWERQALTG